MNKARKTQIQVGGLKQFFADLIFVSKDFFASEKKVFAWTVLLVVFSLKLLLVGLLVIYGFWTNQFWSSLQNLDEQSFLDLLLSWREWKIPFHDTTFTTIMPGFVWLASTYIAIFVLSELLAGWLEIEWRTWMTTRKYIPDWLQHKAFYIMDINHQEGDLGTENPDQRMTDDLRLFVEYMMRLGMSFAIALVKVVVFTFILWTMSWDMHVGRCTIPSAMVWFAIVYASVQTCLTHLIGKRLRPLNFAQQAREADLRRGLFRIREYAGSIALAGGESADLASLNGKFALVRSNFFQILICSAKVNLQTNLFDQLSSVIPVVISAPRFFAKQLTWGDMMQIIGTFDRLQASLSWVVANYNELMRWGAVVARIATFERAIAQAHATHKQCVQIMPSANSLRIQNLSFWLPDGQPLIEAATLCFERGTNVLLSGESGCGKSTFFQVIAGNWPYSSGVVERPALCLFLPQRPYLKLGTLADAVCYPKTPERYKRAEIERALKLVGLEALVDALDQIDNWSQRLSGGEQERLALAGAFLRRPDWLFLDEATASLDAASQRAIYAALKEHLPQTTLISIAHRREVAEFHDRTLVFSKGAPGEAGKLAFAAMESDGKQIPGPAKSGVPALLAALRACLKGALSFMRFA